MYDILSTLNNLEPGIHVLLLKHGSSKIEGGVVGYYVHIMYVLDFIKQDNFVASQTRGPWFDPDHRLLSTSSACSPHA